MSTTVPYKNARIGSLLVLNVFSVVASCIGLNALIRSNQAISSLKKLVEAPMVLEIDTHSIKSVGIVATVGCLLTGLLSFVFLNMTILPGLRKLSNSTLRLQAILLAFTTTWVFASMVPFMVYYVNNSAGVKAFIGQITVPASLVQQSVAKSGHSTKYSTMWYLRLLAIFPWLSIAAAIPTVIVLLRAASAVASTPAPGVAKPASVNGSKESVVQQEKVETA
ncbi:hypothetical protein D9611_009051 [Ephemerocybe angulata]|uniref:Uncharacterized protein n=1 Tax=Ephemerocybe angulata TaxID=980116 RepID=A0A8H5CDL8_9AGAR|nr:hypothetical protein D9611_009051 [Tulosesus angulatus]